MTKRVKTQIVLLLRLLSGGEVTDPGALTQPPEEIVSPLDLTTQVEAMLQRRTLAAKAELTVVAERFGRHVQRGARP